MSTENKHDPQSTIPRFNPIHQKAVIVYRKSQDRTMSVESYKRFKERNSVVNKWRKDNLNDIEIDCPACGWHIPKIFRYHARHKGQLSFLNVHHLIPYSEGGSEEDENLVALCPTCHEIADYLPRMICLPVDSSLKQCVVDHLYLIAINPDEWTRQYNQWNLETKRRAIDTLRGQKQQIHQPFYVLLSAS